MVEATARQARELHAKGTTLIEELLDTGALSHIGFTSSNVSPRSLATSTAISSNGANSR